MADISYIKYHEIRLYTKHKKYFELTNIEFNKLVLIYYNILLKRDELLELSPRNCRTAIEKLTILNKQTGEIPEEYFETDAPSRIRRAACMQAIGQVKLYKQKEKKIKEGKLKISKPKETKKFNMPTFFYKELYKFQENRILKIKLYNGETWKWYEAKLSKWNIPEGADLKSIKVNIKNGFVMLSIPEKCRVENILPIKERMKKRNIKVCGVAFSGRDNIATCVIIDKKGKFINSLFIKGGNQYKRLILKYIGQIKRSNKKSNYSFNNPIENHNKKYWQKIRRINSHYSEMVSKRIVDFCVENGVDVIAMSTVQCDNEVLTYNKKFNSANLRERITTLTKEKCITKNILRTFISMKGKTNKCYKCGELLERTIDKKTKKVIKEDKAICEMGHQIDYFFNFAMNIAISCFEKYK